MDKERLRNEIKNSLEEGYTEEQVIRALKGDGYPETLIQELLEDIDSRRVKRGKVEDEEKETWQDSSKQKDRGSVTEDINPSAFTKSYLFIHIAHIFYLFGIVQSTWPEAVGFVPSYFELPILASYLVFWLGFPVALYYDKSYVAKNSGWKTSKLYYLGVLASVFGFVAIWIYIYKRKKALGPLIKIW